MRIRYLLFLRRDASAVWRLRSTFFSSRRASGLVRLCVFDGTAHRSGRDVLCGSLRFGFCGLGFRL